MEPLFFLVREQHAVSKINSQNEISSKKESQNEIIFKGINKIDPRISWQPEWEGPYLSQ